MVGPPCICFLFSRWDRITELVNQVSNRTLKEVTAKARECEVLAPALGGTEAFQQFKKCKAT